MIDRIRIRNFRSLHDVDVRLEPLTVLIGRSGSGKSNFVRAVRTFRDILTGAASQDISHQVQQQLTPSLPHDVKGLQSIQIDFTVRGLGSLEYHLTIGHTRGQHRGLGTSFHLDERLVAAERTVFQQSGLKWVIEPPVSPRPQPGQLVLGKLTGLREATIAYTALTRGLGFYDFTGSVLQTPAPIENSPGYLGIGDNPIQVASRISDDLQRLTDWTSITKSLTAISSRIKSLELLLPGREQLQVGYRVTGNKVLTVNVAEESEGFRRYLAHLLALYQTPPKQTMFFEHPETGIHPGALSALFDEFKTHVNDNRGQVILTTHSPQFLDHFEPQQIRVVELKDGQTRIGSLAADQAHVIRDRLMTAGELLTVDEGRIDPPAAIPVGAV